MIFQNANIITFILLSLLAIVVRLRFPDHYKYAKPLPLMFLLSYLWFDLRGLIDVPCASWLIFVGLIFGLLGDFFLLKKETFMFGLVSFLVGHVFYSLAMGYGFYQLPLVIIAVITIFGLVFLNPIIGSLRMNGQAKKIIPVYFYFTVLLLMVLSALAKVDSMPVLALAASFFFFSDGVLAINRFYQPVRFGGIFILSTYYTAQFLFALAALQWTY